MKIDALQLKATVCANYYGEGGPEKDQIFLSLMGKEASFCDGEEVFGALTVAEAREVAHALSELADWAESGGLMEDEPQ